MRRPATESEANAPLTPAVFHILLALAGGERHGYAIMREAEMQGFRMGPGTLYGSIKRLLEDGAIEEVAPSEPDEADERRRYYRMTESGLRVARAEASRLARLVERASTGGLLNDHATRGAS